MSERCPLPGLVQPLVIAVERRVALVLVEAEGQEGLGRGAGAEAEFEPPARQQIEHRGILGDADRVLHRQDDDAGAEPDPRRARGDEAEERQRRGQSPFVAVEMVLGDPGAVEALPLGMDDLLGGEPVAFAGRRIVEDAGEEAQSFPAHAASAPPR